MYIEFCCRVTFVGVVSLICIVGLRCIVGLCIIWSDCEVVCVLGDFFGLGSDAFFGVASSYVYCWRIADFAVIAWYCDFDWVDFIDSIGCVGS